MAEDKRNLTIRCPECFAAGNDVELNYDHRADEFFCMRCFYTADPVKARRDLDMTAMRKYKSYYNVTVDYKVKE